MVGGFALLAFPAEYGNSGIMTFIVNHDGTVFEKDLGPETAKLARKIESFSPEGIFEAERTGKGFACGHAAVAAVMWAARELGADSVKILKYATSGDVSGDYSGVVGYGSAAILKQR